MTREQLLEKALRELLATARNTVVAQERFDYWSQFQTNSATFQRADAKHALMIARLERAEAMAVAALRGDVTLFREAETR